MIYPLNPHDVSKNKFAFLNNGLISLRVWLEKNHESVLTMYIAILFNLPPTSGHLHPLQVENLRLRVDEDFSGKFSIYRVNSLEKACNLEFYKSRAFLLRKIVDWIHFWHTMKLTSLLSVNYCTWYVCVCGGCTVLNVRFYIWLVSKSWNIFWKKIVIKSQGKSIMKFHFRISVGTLLQHLFDHIDSEWSLVI